MKVETLLQDLDAVIVTSPASLYYLSGVENADAVILLTRSSRYYVTSPLYEVEAHRSLSPNFTLVILGAEEKISFLRKRLSSFGHVGIESANMSVLTYQTIFSELKAEVTDVSKRISLLRRVKSSSEIALIKKAEAIVDYAFSSIMRTLCEGVTEKQVRQLLQDAMLRDGADGFAFDTIVAFGENAAKPHAVPSDRALRKGDCIVMDFGAKFGGYCSDFTRTLYCGDPSEKFLAAYDVVLQAHLAAVSYVENGGRNAAEADAVARKIIDDSPFKGAFNHSLGHGVGIEIHETPYLKPNSKDVLEEGSVFTIEPGVYFEGEFGIRIESLLAIENGKPTVIDRSNKEIITV